MLPFGCKRVALESGHVSRTDMVFEASEFGKGPMASRRAFHEFFAGSGLVSYGLSSCFRATWANDISKRKEAVYRANMDGDVFHLGDIAEVSGSDLPDAELSWASFPCQDLSLAGKIGGIHSARSGLVWQWLRILDELGPRAPRVVCLENVVGLVSSRGGEDYKLLHSALSERGYKVGVMLVNADLFLPQSRPRVFVVATKGAVPRQLVSGEATWLHSKSIRAIGASLDDFVWWSAPLPDAANREIDSIVDRQASYDKSDLVRLIPPSHLRKFIDSGCEFATGYRRTRNGKQVLELRCDGVAGCLRTPAGGSSKQFLVHRTGSEVEIRLLTVREVARLMGAPDDWDLPGSYNDGYFAMGDAVAAPVAKWIGETFLYPLTEAAYGVDRKA